MGAEASMKHSYRWEEVENLLTEAAHSWDVTKCDSRKVFPGAVISVYLKGMPVYEQAFGCRSLVPEVTLAQIDTVYDVASLTKVLVTTTLLMKLVAKGRVSLDKRLSHLLQTFGTLGKQDITIKHLLAHCAGFAATEPFYKEIMRAHEGERAGMLHSRGAADMVYHQIYRAPLKYKPGTKSIYSDVDFLLLGHLIESLEGGKPLERIAYKEIFKPLGMKATGYIHLNTLKSSRITPVAEMIAPTSDCPMRGRVLNAEVQDENAWAMGGVAGHAGIFSTATDVQRFATEMLNCYSGKSEFIPKKIVQEFWTKDETVENSSWALGWDTPSPDESSSGKLFSPESVGHLGYTGCSLWIDPKREVSVVLLSNRVHPSIENKNIKRFRPKLHDAVMKALGF